MYNNFNSYGASSFGNTSQGAQSSQGFQGNNVQNQGYQKQYKPLGNVQSFYNQSNTGQFSQGPSQIQGQNQSQGYNQPASTESFHTANYRGNQQGHDAYQRSNFSMPSQQQPSNFQSGYSSNIPTNNQFISNQPQQFGYAATQQPFVSSQYGSSVQTYQQPYAQANVSPNAFHMANYRGNQPGHDAYKRSDSSTPSQQSFQSGFGTQQGIQQGTQQGIQQGIQQQGMQSVNTGFNNPGIGQQFGYNSSF